MWKYLPRSIYSPDTAASTSPSDSPASNLEPSAMSNGTSTASKSLRPVSGTTSWMTRQSLGETSENSMESRGVAEWISSLPLRPANLIVKPENYAGPATIETSFPILSESLAKYDPELCIWKTSQVLMFDQKMDGQPTLGSWSENWPRSGTTQDLTLYPRKTLAHRISENGGGLWPTPTTQEIEHPDIELDDTGRRKTLDGRTGSDARSLNLADSTHLWPTPVADGDRTTNYKQGGTSLGFAARSPMLPTPSATKNTPNTVDVADLVDSDGNPWELGRKPYDRRTGQPVSTTLADVVKTKGWSIPTPTPSDNWTGNLESSQQSDDSMHSVTLPGFVARFPTSTTEVRYNTPNTMDGMAPKSQKALDHEHDTARPGRTNPNNLRDQVAVQEGLRWWPTPTGDDANNATRTSGAFQSLTRKVVTTDDTWPTPTTSQDYKPVRPLAPSEANGTHGTMLVGAVGDKHPDHIGGQLSATWVCWLMGLPLGFDSLDPLPEGAYEEWAEHMEQGTWWAEERGLPRLAEGQKDRVNRLKCLGNGVVPASGALAFITLEEEG